MKYLILGIILGLIIGNILFNRDVIETNLNRMIISTYLETNVGKNTFKKILYDNCYFTGQYLLIDKKFEINMIEQREFCSKQSNNTIQAIQDGFIIYE